MPERAPAQLGTWRELFGRDHRAPVIVMAGGIGLNATNIYLTTTLLPSAVAEIGGERFYAWTMTVFLVASVISSMLVSRALARLGARGAYVLGFAGFAAGTVVAGAAPTMAVLLAGRGLQGLAAGLLAGLGFAVVRTVLPASLWQRSIALMSAMWGVGNILGPVIGGFFAQFGVWRGAFALLAVISLALVGLALRALPAGTGAGDADLRVPWLALTLLTVAVTVVSVASIVTGTAALVLVAVAVATAAGFVWRERAAGVRVLPEPTYRGRSPLRWIYASVFVLAIASTVETFVPLFGQRLGGLGPLAAGFLGAMISWGWSSGSIAASSAGTPAVSNGVRVAGPLVIAAGLGGYGLLQHADPSGLVLAGWFLTLFIAGCGIGIAMAHWLTAGLQLSDDPAEAAQVSAGLNTTQLIAYAVGAALAGLLVSAGGPAVAGSARALSYGYAALGLAGVAVAGYGLLAARRYRDQPASNSSI